MSDIVSLLYEKSRFAYFMDLNESVTKMGNYMRFCNIMHRIYAENLRMWRSLLETNDQVKNG